ncbi:MAG: hypothetical protein WDO72_08270 [Pseudomonadota bacterium]
MKTHPRFLSQLALAALSLAALFPSEARATPPPTLPLPECIYVAGQPAGGACPAISLRVSGNAAGRLGSGSSVVVNTVPAVTVCDYWSAHTYEWRPSGCYAEVGAPVIVNCGVIDVRHDNQYREMPCEQALYKSTSGLPPLFTIRRPEGSEDPNSGSVVCGAIPSYHTYIYGGPATKEEAVWRTRGPAALKCEITFNGPRPNGMIGPTWVKVRVRINYAETPDVANGRPMTAEFFVPVDGDMRDVADIDVTALGSLTELNWDEGRLIATYRATLTNLGDLDAENVDLLAQFPFTAVVQGVTGADCKMPGDILNAPDPAVERPIGGRVLCKWERVAAKGSAQVEIVARIYDATDLDALQRGLGSNFEKLRGNPEGVEFRVKASNDSDPDNNEYVAKVAIPFRSGSYEETRFAMEALAPYFDYKTDKYNLQCNLYEDDISARLKQIHIDHPEVFANLSYGGVTSGQYLILGIDSPVTRAGHVGVVVYVKGTNYRETGIVINGTPMISPLNLHSAAGPDGETLLTSTATSGLYLRTPANLYPNKGRIQPETNSFDGFEGSYPTNQQEFTYGGSTPAPRPTATPLACPITPEGVMITTESPVEITATNSQGKRVLTDNGMIVTQELGTGIHSMGFEHDDGTFGWTMLLPLDDYDVQLRGVGTGAYRLTLTTFDADGNPVKKVTDGFTNPGQIDRFSIEPPDLSPPPTPAPPVPEPPSGNAGNGGNVGGGKSGGGGAVDAAMLLALMLILGFVLRRVRSNGE